MSPTDTTPKQDHQLVLDKNRPVHFVGIGGIGMSGLAKLLAESGFQVSGSDLHKSKYTEKLEAKGVTIHEGHIRENVPQNAIVVATTAVQNTNPEIAEAHQQNLPVFHRSDLLREILQGKLTGHKVTVGISGTHGKTSATGMMGHTFHHLGVKPTIVAGGIIPGLNTNALWGDAQQIAIAELDESDGTLVQYQPTHSILLNLELDHADHFVDGLSQLTQTFETFLNALPAGHQVFLNYSCPNLRQLADKLLAKADHPELILLAPGDIFTGKEPQVTYNIKNAREHEPGHYLGYVYKKNKLLGELILDVPGSHQLFNALATIAVGDQLGYCFDDMREHLGTFQGMGRRHETVGRYNGAKLVDDYAHHPTETQAMVKVGKESLSETQGKLVVIFQPHRYSRLKTFWNEFIDSFALADILIVTDVFEASEQPISGITSEQFVAAVKEKGVIPDVRYFSGSDFEPLQKELQALAQPTDIFMTMGAGDITRLLRNWPEQ